MSATGTGAGGTLFEILSAVSEDERRFIEGSSAALAPMIERFMDLDLSHEVNDGKNCFSRWPEL